MKYPVLLIISILLYTSSQAQYRKSTEVKAGQDIAQAFSPNGFYRFPQFTTGALFSRMRSGNSSQLFNYNLLYDKIQFINHGDTLEMSNPTLFDSILIDKQVFFYRQEYGFLEQVAASGSINLVKKTSIKIKPMSVGAYDGATTTSAINKVNTYTTGFNVYNFTVNEDVAIKESVDWYWMNTNGDIKKATKNNLFLFLPESKQKKAQAFMKENKISFAKEEDLARLIRSI